jgi:hypothetical protein
MVSRIPKRCQKILQIRQKWGELPWPWGGSPGRKTQQPGRRPLGLRAALLPLPPASPAGVGPDFHSTPPNTILTASRSATVIPGAAPYDNHAHLTIPH